MVNISGSKSTSMFFIMMPQSTLHTYAHAVSGVWRAIRCVSGGIVSRVRIILDAAE